MMKNSSIVASQTVL